MQFPESWLREFCNPPIPIRIPHAPRRDRKQALRALGETQEISICARLSIFYFNQRANAMSDKRYIVGGLDGWLNVKREPSATIIALPEFIKVEVTSSLNGRDYFVVKEGAERGNKFSVKTGNLKNGNPSYRSAANLEFSLSRKKLDFFGYQVAAFTDDENPISIGIHPIQIPDFPHSGGIGYMGHSRYAKTWFYLGQGNAVYGRNDRYLHPGSFSAGCITVDPNMWTRLYQYLILCRSGNEKTVGTVCVVR